MLALHKLYLWARGREKTSDTTRPIVGLILTAINFHIVCVTWVFFRAETLQHAVDVLRRVVDWSTGLMVPWLFPAVLIPALVLIQAIQARTNVTERLLRHPRSSRMVMYFGVGLMLALMVSSRPVDFIYFVF
jgi:D-alanyl-lipoteichoic acid acyltransferase DltB (MBOAT superfamily)